MFHPARLLALLAFSGGASAMAQFNDAPAHLDAARAYGAELVADARTHASFLADGDSPSSGWAKNKFFVGDGGANVLNIGGYIQTRFLTNSRDNQPGKNDFTEGFQMRRTRLVASGSVWSKQLTYVVQGEFSRSTGDFSLVDAFGKYTFDNGVYVKWGQYKLPLLREELVSDTLLLAVDRSAVNATFTQNRSQAVELGYAAGQFRVMGDFSDGLNTLNTDFTAATEADYAFTGRGEWMFAGDDFKRFDDNTSWKGDAFAGMAGIAAHYQSGGHTGGTANKDLFEATADVSVEGNGWNAFVEGVWRNTDVHTTPSTDDFGIVAQAGFFATDQLEFFGRYDVIIPDIGSDFNSATAGLNYYISPKGHAAKLTADVIYYIDATTNAAILGQTNTGIDLLPDAKKGEVAVRLQMQLIF